MLTNVNRRLTYLPFLVAVLLATAACGAQPPTQPTPSPASSSPPNPARPSPSGVAADDGEVVVSGSLPAVWFANSLRSMVETYDTILVGKVLGVSYVRRRYIDLGPDLPPAEEVPDTVFSVEVAEVISGARVQAGDTISLMQVGGVGEDGRLYQLEGNPLIEPGPTYLLFLQDTLPVTGRDEFAGAVFGRFVVTDGGLIRPNGWETVAGVSAVSGVTAEEARAALASPDPQAALDALARVTVDEAAARIRAAVAQLPTPTPAPAATPTPAPTAAAAPTPTPTPTPQP